MTADDNELNHQRGRALVVAAALLLFGYNMISGDGADRLGLTGFGLVLTAVTVAAVAAFAAALWWGRRQPVAATVGHLVAAAATIGLYILAPHRPSQLMLFLIIGVAAASPTTWRPTVVVAVTVGGYAAVVVAFGRDLDELWSAVGMIGLAVAVTAGRNRRRTRAIEQQNLVLAERARIAREIHDILAHSLSAQLVHLEGAKLLIGAGRTDEAADRVERARELARGGLTETRRALDTLRGHNLDLDEALRELAAEHREATTGGCEVTVVGDPRDLPPEAGLTLVRTAQEALTNVRKHATGADVDITLEYRETECELRITDTGGTGGPMTDTGSGYGLLGMRERAELIGGTLAAGPTERGFAVLLRVPT